MKNSSFPFVVFAVAFLATGCTPSAISTSKEDAQKAVDSMTFAKSTKNGLCFGIIGSWSASSSWGSTSMSATLIPCNQVKDQL